MDASKTGFFLAVGALAGVVLLTRRQSDLFSAEAETIPISKLIDPAAVSPIANDIGGTGDDFALNAWQYVGGSIDYSYFDTDLYFNDSSVECLKCMMPLQVEASGASNCVGKAALLTSILRNRVGPDRVYMAVGQFHWLGKDGGHAWVVLQRDDGKWYLLESTMAPPADPWRTVASLTAVYTAEALVNDAGLICYDPEICAVDLHVNAGLCPCRLLTGA